MRIKQKKPANQAEEGTKRKLKRLALKRHGENMKQARKRVEKKNKQEGCWFLFSTHQMGVP